MINRSKNSLSLAISALLASSLSYAQTEPSTDVERISVYGALTTTPLAEMASSIDVISLLDIEQRHAQHLDEILNKAANVNFATGASRGRFVQIRGIGERSQFVDPVNPSVGYLVDGINYSGMLAGASTFDVSQIEIFKGPNSARFGADGLAGMINVISTPTSDTSSGDIQLGLANYNSWYAGAALGGTLSDSVNYRFSVHQNTSDGFIKNTFLGREDTNNQDEFTARAKLDWQISPDFKLNTTVHLIDVDNGYDAFSIDRNRTTLSDEPGKDTQHSEAIAITGDYQGLSWANMQVQVTYLQADLDYGFDEDWTYVGISPYDPVNDPKGEYAEYSSTDYYFREKQDSSVQIKFNSKKQSDNDWVVGLYYADKDEDLERQYTWFNAAFLSGVARQDMAVFAQYKQDISDTQWLTGSLRLASQQFDYTDSLGITKEIDNNDWGAELSYQQQASANTMLYLSVVRSYKMGGVNASALSKANDEGLEDFRQIILDNSEFGAESLIGTEFGLKGANDDGSLTVDLSVFYQWRDDVQYKNSFVIEQKFVDFYNNAASGRNYGLEVNVRAIVNPSVEVFVNLGLLKTKIEGITRRNGDVFETINDREQAHAPRYQVNAGVNWQLADNLSWLFEVDLKDDFYYSFGHDQRSDQQTIVHTSVNYEIGAWDLSLYARNLFDQEYANRGFAFGNDPRDGYEPHTYEQFGEPRRIGASVNYHF
ncbi:TonB-dependent receptor plug domain-containing protein [Paraglaciecola sp.]|uniref:TonB-dependent receptor n=1 Tax=Paraglaciecola sp. TaxID=1920173 RepID=UPI0030F43B22